MPFNPVKSREIRQAPFWAPTSITLTLTWNLPFFLGILEYSLILSSKAASRGSTTSVFVASLICCKHTNHKSLKYMYMYTVWSDQAYLYSVLYNVELRVYIIFSPFRLSNLFIIILYEVIIRCPKLSHHYRAVLNFQKKSQGQLAPKFSFLVARTSILVTKNYI